MVFVVRVTLPALRGGACFCFVPSSLPREVALVALRRGAFAKPEHPRSARMATRGRSYQFTDVFFAPRQRGSPRRAATRGVCVKPDHPRSARMATRGRSYQFTDVFFAPRQRGSPRRAATRGVCVKPDHPRSARMAT